MRLASRFGYAANQIRRELIDRINDIIARYFPSVLSA